MEYDSYYGIEIYTFRTKISDFGVDFSYLQSFYQRHVQSCLSYRPRAMLVHCIIWLVIGSAIYLNAVLFCQKHNKWGVGVVAFHNSGHRLALGHVNDMRCQGKVHAFLFVWSDSLLPINNLSDIKGRVYLGRISAKLGLMCLALGHNVVTLVSH